MPSSLPIAAFVFGAVLLLVSLLSGGFKIFGAEVSGTAGRMARVVAFVFGIVMITVGLTWDDGTHPTAGAAPRGPAMLGSVPAPMTPAPMMPAPAPPQQQLAMPAQPAARLNVRWSVSSEQTGAALAQMPERNQLLMQAMAEQMDVHVARVVIANVGTTPVSVTPQRIAIAYGGVPLATQIASHPAALRPTTLAPNQHVDGLLLFRAPLVVLPALLTLTYADPQAEVTYGN